MRLVRLVLRSVMSQVVVLVAGHRRDRLSAVDVTKEPNGCQRPSNGQQKRDEQKQSGMTLHPTFRLSHDIRE